MVGELGCSDLAKHEIKVIDHKPFKHEIKVIDHKPFKERFRRIHPPMVDEVHIHVKEILEAGTIHPSQSLWCYTIVLVYKKDGGLLVLHWLPQTKWESQERLLSTLPDTRSHWEFSWCRILFLIGYEGQFLADSNKWDFKTVYCFYLGELRVLGLCNALTTFQRLMQNCLGRLNMTYCLIYLDDVIVCMKTEVQHLYCLCIVFVHFREHYLKLKPTKCEFFKNEINSFGLWSLQRWCMAK